MATLLLLFYNAVLLITVGADSIGYYAIPDPEIIAFQGGGIRVILEDANGISVFRFHANINEDMKQLYPGTINIEATTKVGDRWILEDKNVKLRTGDTLFYWMFVEKDRLGYVKQPVQFKIRHLVPYYKEDKGTHMTTTNQSPQTTVATTSRTTPTPPTTTTPQAPTALPPTTCPTPSSGALTLSFLQDQINTLNRKLDLLTSITTLQNQVDVLGKKFEAVSASSSLQDEVKNISSTVNLILVTLNGLPEAKKLTISGMIPPDFGSNPDNVVRFVIWEKLNMRVDVVSAVRNTDNNIVFEVRTVREKFDVLMAAKEKLRDSRIIIS